MTKSRIGSQASWSLNYVEHIDGTGLTGNTNVQLSSSDSGKVFMITQYSGVYSITLPKLSTEMAGWHATFRIKAASSGNTLIMAYPLQEAGTTGDSDTMLLKEFAATDHSAATQVAQDGLVFTGNAAVAGDYAEVFTDGTNWYATAFYEDAAHGAGVD